MDFDDLVIGSGISALGAVFGLLDRPGGRIGVLCGPSQGRFEHYDAQRTVPCAYLGEGGLGSHWHGVIPTGRFGGFDRPSDTSLASMFARFYPGTDLRSRLGPAGTFVPWRPIRPARALRRLAARHGPERIVLLPEMADRVRIDGQGVQVESSAGSHRAVRGWLAAGALHSPKLVAGLSPAAVRDVASDHVFLYVGQVAGLAAPQLVRTRDGVFHPARVDDAHTALYSVRPAAFAYRHLDHGIQERAAFGLPTGHALKKIARRVSPGLLVEAFYNRFGLFGDAAMHSVYAQVQVRDAYDRTDGATPLRPHPSRIRAATDRARAAQPFEGLIPSRLAHVCIPGIHLHHSLDVAALRKDGVNTPDSPLQVVDASVLTDPGPNHHSFAMMVSAYERASGVSAAVVPPALELASAGQC